MIEPQVELLESGVLVIDYGKTNRLTYAQFRRGFELFEQQVASQYPGIKFPHLLKAQHLFVLDFSAARFTRSHQVANVLSAVAVVPANAIERKVIRVYEHYAKPPYPFKDFYTEEEAITWLEGFVDERYLEAKEQELAS